jgi:hypothetical protein
LKKIFIDKATCVLNFKKDTGKNLILSRYKINNIKFQYSDKFNNLSLEELVKTIKNDSYELEVKTFDTKYIYSFFKNKQHIKENREEKIIIFGKKDNLNLSENDKRKEFFIDTTFRIVPKKFRPYKCMTISSIIDSNIKIYCFILYKFQDKINYERIFTYLKENFNFIPKIVHIDYEKPLYMTFKNQKIYEKKITTVFCFFHYIKSIRT